MLMGTFRGGSVGAAEGYKFVEAAQRAAKKRYPFLAYVHGTAGIRIQEGTHGVIQMPRCTVAVRRYIESGGLYMKVEEVYEMTEADKKWECELVFKGAGPDSEKFWEVAPNDHPGVKMVLAQKEFNIAGPVKVLSQGEYPEKFPGVYMTPAQLRAKMDERGWQKVAALQLRNPMHRSHEYLAKIGVEVCDGVVIHSLVGSLKPGDIPAEVRVKCIDTLVDKYFVKDFVIQAGYPLDMRYAGPREALLHATFRQNYGINNLLVGRDHAGVGDFYGMFLEVFCFRSLFRNTAAEVREFDSVNNGPRTIYYSSKWLWAFALVFHYCFLLIFIRHFRFFMQLLNEWRDEALRKENRIYVASNGKKWTISLQNTCLKCHNDYKGFCEKCHVPLCAAAF